MAVTTEPRRHDSVTAQFGRPGRYPAQAAARRRPWLAPAATGLVVSVAVAYTAWQDPNGNGAFPVCPTYSVFGIDCPGCGGLRATHAYTRGDILGAFDHNILIATLLPLALVIWVIWLLRSLGVNAPGWPPMSRLPRATPWVAGALVIAFAVVRNISGVGVFEYLAATA